MDDGGTNSPATHQEVSATVTAASMINAADRINLEAYQANLRRIHDVKEMVRELEANNETAHKNYLVDQLERRAKEGRDAEDMLARLKSQPRLSETVRITNEVPSENSEVVLPTTATLMEVPEPHSSCSTSTPITTFHPPITQQSHSTTRQWRYPEPIQPYDNFRYYGGPQPTVALPSQAPVNPGQAGWHSTTRNVLPQSAVHNPLVHQTSFQPAQAWQPSQSWNSYPHQVVILPPSESAPAAPRYNSSTAWKRTMPGHGGLSAGPSNPTYHEQGIPASSTARAPAATYSVSQTLPAHPLTSLLEVPLQGAPVKPLILPPVQSHPERVIFQSPPVSQTVITPELQQPHRPLQQPQQHRQHPQSERYPQLPPQPRLHPHQPQPQFHTLPRPPLQPEQHPQQSQIQLPSQGPSQSSLTQQVPPQTDDCIPFSNSLQPQNQLSQPAKINVQEQAPRRGSRPIDQATFNKCLREAAESGWVHLKSFCFHAKAAGISDEWLKTAFASVPRGVWNTVVAQINQSGSTLNTMPVANATQPKSSTAVSTSIATLPAPSSTVVPVIQATSIAQETGKPGGSAEAVTHSAARPASGSYAAQLQYYAQQATKSTLPQAENIRTQLPVNITWIPTALATPQRDPAQAQANVRTPKDANKSTLARDILRSLAVPELYQDDEGGDHLPLVTSVASPKPPAIPLATILDVARPPAIPPAISAIEEEPQPVLSQSLSGDRNEENGLDINGPIMIDLTLDESDKSEDEKTREPDFPMQTSDGVADAPSHPASINTTNDTPLLENLTLKEPFVDVAGDTNNVDVRMSSPPLLLPTEENVESELVYPPLAAGVAVPVTPNFEPIPCEASVPPSDGQLPLFLPSPPVSPVHTEPLDTDLEMINDESRGLPRKRRSVDVEGIKLDTGLVTTRNRKRRKRQVYVLVPPAPLYVKKARMKGRAVAASTESDLEGVGQDEEPQYNHLEQLLIEESKSRLLERRCRWSNCDAILNCATNLLSHLKRHAREENFQAPFPCRWMNCQRQFEEEEERDAHLARHTIRPLPCPLEGCDKQFDKPVEAMQHEVQHQRAEYRESPILKPTCQPIVPAIPARLGPPPYQLPSHRVIPRRVVKCRISADRHATLGPWILWNIFSPVDLNSRKQNASMRGRSTRHDINHDVDSSDRRDDYDFLLALSSYPGKHLPLDDLDSTLITASAARGLTLWGPTFNNTVGSATPEGHADAPPAPLASGTMREGERDERDDVGVAEEQRTGPTMGEEDTVEKMLIV